MSHTSGPWLIGYDPDDGLPLDIITADNRVVAFLVSDGNRADASLISAATDLLAALKIARGYVAAFPRAGGDLAAIDAAIAKATAVTP